MLSSLPCQLSEMPATNDLISLYNRCQADIQNMEIPKTIMEDTEFTARLARVQRDLQHVYPLMACGVCQFKQMREKVSIVLYSYFVDAESNNGFRKRDDQRVFGRFRWFPHLYHHAPGSIREESCSSRYFELILSQS